MSVVLKALSGIPEEMRELQRVLEAAPTYAYRLTGHPPGAADAQSTYSILPPNKSYEDKFVFGIYLDAEMIGCIDIIRGYPDERTAMLGLLLLTEPFQGRGFGSAAYRHLEVIISNWEEIVKIRIGIVRTNAEVIPFWERMGFVDTGVRKPYLYDKVESEHLVFERNIAS